MRLTEGAGNFGDHASPRARKTRSRARHRLRPFALSSPALLVAHRGSLTSLVGRVFLALFLRCSERKPCFFKYGRPIRWIGDPAEVSPRLGLIAAYGSRWWSHSIS